MEISYTISKEELISFHSKHFAETKSYKRATIKQAVLVIIFIVLTYIILKSLYYCIIELLGWFALMLFRKRRMLFLLRRQLNNIFISDKYKDYFENTKLGITEAGLTTNTSLSKKIYNWHSIKIISLLDNYIFIITAANDEFLIPISAFKSNTDKELFLKELIGKTNLKVSYTYPIDTKY